MKRSETSTNLQIGTDFIEEKDISKEQTVVNASRVGDPVRL